MPTAGNPASSRGTNAALPERPLKGSPNSWRWRPGRTWGGSRTWDRRNWMHPWWQREKYGNMSGWWYTYIALWKIWVRQLGWWHSQYMDNNHQPNKHVFFVICELVPCLMKVFLITLDKILKGWSPKCALKIWACSTTPWDLRWNSPNTKWTWLWSKNCGAPIVDHNCVFSLALELCGVSNHIHQWLSPSFWWFNPHNFMA